MNGFKSLVLDSKDITYLRPENDQILNVSTENVINSDYTEVGTNN